MSYEPQRSLVQRAHRGPDDLILTDEQPRPVPGPGEYLVRVAAAGVNFADVLQSRGRYPGGPNPPHVAGFEGAGTIVQVGPGVRTALPVGAHVVGTGRGAFAEYARMPAAGALPVPDGWSDAAALGMVPDWATALAALKPLGQVAPGETVLVHAAAGGVGQAAVRLARHYGARVIATAAPAEHEIVRALGADVVLDGRSPNLAAEIGGGVDLVLESAGRATFAISLAVTRPFTGRIVVFGAVSDDTSVSTHELVFEHPVQIKGLHIGALAQQAPEAYRPVPAELAALIDAGVYPPGRPQVRPLGDGPAALRELEAGLTSAKVALDPWA